jgi:hypothetical protein
LRVEQRLSNIVRPACCAGSHLISPERRAPLLPYLSRLPYYLTGSRTVTQAVVGDGMKATRLAFQSNTCDRGWLPLCL